MVMPSEYHQLLDAAPDAMVILDSQGRVTTLNSEAERLFGWSEEEMLGQRLTRVIPARFHDLGASSEVPFTAGALTCLARRRDEGEFPVELTCRPIGSNGNAARW